MLRESLSASVIIPTYDRAGSLAITLGSLKQQSLGAHRYEVIVVDDGSSDGTRDLCQKQYPFELRYYHQSNQGSAVARNRGTEIAEGAVLVFIDDDISLAPRYLEGLLEEHQSHSRIVAMGRMLRRLPRNVSLFARVYGSGDKPVFGQTVGQFVEFTACTTNNLSVKMADFCEIGVFRDIAGDGRALWGDVEFGYRAKVAGFSFRLCGKALCYHSDYSVRDFETALARSYETGVTAFAVANTTPEIIKHLPMFDDKTPIRLGSDPPNLVFRKVLRRFASSGPTLRLLRGITNLIEARWPSPNVLTPLYRWTLGGELFRGFRGVNSDLSANSGPR